MSLLEPLFVIDWKSTKLARNIEVILRHTTVAGDKFERSLSKLERI